MSDELYELLGRRYAALFQWFEPGIEERHIPVIHRCFVPYLASFGVTWHEWVAEVFRRAEIRAQATASSGSP